MIEHKTTKEIILDNFEINEEYMDGVDDVVWLRADEHQKEIKRIVLEIIERFELNRQEISQFIATKQHIINDYILCKSQEPSEEEQEEGEGK